MRRLSRVIVLTTLLASVLVTPALASEGGYYDHYQGNVVCRGMLQDVLVEGNVYVQPGHTCFLDGAYVKGNIEVDAGRLGLRNSHVKGNVDSRYAIRLGINASVIDGNVEARFTKRFMMDGMEKPSFVMGSEVNGNIRLGRNMAKYVLRSNDVDGNVQAYYNRGRIRIVSNFVDGNISCIGNAHPPYLRDNYVNGNTYCR